ncbi:MAG: hypothetical protein QOH66_381 [Actinomycetota bacterium]|nr:hypothetical protein [Actinomycetota bacterium]
MAVLLLPQTEPGKQASGDLDVHNTGLQWAEGLRLWCPALVGAGGERIDGHHVTFHPAVLNVASWQAGRVHVTVDVPSSTRRGRYTGLVEASGVHGSWCVLSVNVN